MKKVTISIKGKPVEIELTADQLAQVKKETSHYTDIKTLKDALDYVGESLESFNNRTQFDDDAQRAYKELEVIVEAVRQGNTLGHKEGDTWCYPWFNSKRSSVGFSYDDYACADAVSDVGSRLTYKSKDIAIYAGKQFLDIYNKYIS